MGSLRETDACSRWCSVRRRKCGGHCVAGPTREAWARRRHNVSPITTAEPTFGIDVLRNSLQRSRSRYSRAQSASMSNVSSDLLWEVVRTLLAQSRPMSEPQKLNDL